MDPLKEMDASAAGVQLGVTSRTRIAAEQGDDFDDILDELAQETAALESAGISTDVKPSAQPTPVTPAEPAPVKSRSRERTAP